MAWIDLLVFAAGGTVVWFFKDTFLKWWQGAEKFAANLKAKAAVVEAKAAAVKAAVKS
jgi:hypothetical protein